MSRNILGIAHLNAQSLRNNFSEFKDLAFECNFDIIGITETWLSPEVPSDAVHINGYKFIRKDRVARGGGVGIYVKSEFVFSILEQSESHSASEQLWILLKINRIQLALGILYRRQEFGCDVFLSELENSVVSVLPITDEIVCLGDFNINMLNLNNRDTLKYTTMIDFFSLKQIIQEPTRVTRTTSTLIDHILVSEGKVIIECGVIGSHGLSDHCLIYCQYPLHSNVEMKSHLHTYRDFNRFNQKTFDADLQAIPWHLMIHLRDVNDKIHFLNANLTELFNIHAPIRTIKIVKKNPPWMTDNIKFMIKLRNKSLVKFKRTLKDTDWNYYKQLRNYTTFAVKQEKKAYIEFRLNQNKHKTLWQDLNRTNIYTKAESHEVPIHLSDPNKINEAFVNSSKSLSTVNFNNLIRFYCEDFPQKFGTNFQFSLTDGQAILKILSNIKSNAVGTDELSIKMLRLCCPFIVPYVTHIINSCIIDSIFPDSWKTAKVIPVPKSNAPTDYKDLRPISILPCLSKVFEKIMMTQMQSYMQSIDIIPETQSGF
ncbi:uncharacterized protein LOC116181009 isoform X1 [Photinus pyralis]|uniref:uncharacterized protein LOC116161908 isoform X1 n=1 Tax=Photinus pyralis TaxID=7054 RepID=UPI0012673DBC|nr:uncharacterized protein LOC116161908 isoform X1 [Photinus pyralis]XP_031331266.1 uncharacterized protein LOC116161908 isoform X1 [Photinus pyralis]XP_031331267.1 uncharacterized protein LOC116161908 isoform X1 [Photinus pyralis]XP_031342903.1 uncharacterized protein LOC116170563 isoform X1 [Photinus pyralis]XP_031342904.1 uncharacterized protein LOC116170563 isoform X1 [Photinus pyralis]XP_031342906.1 uncharacterized protein LOC116170563 isoform X1 [Photinus pyralis]XP_031357080.1 uncharac